MIQNSDIFFSLIVMKPLLLLCVQQDNTKFYSRFLLPDSRIHCFSSYPISGYNRWWYLCWIFIFFWFYDTLFVVDVTGNKTLWCIFTPSIKSLSTCTLISSTHSVQYKIKDITMYKWYQILVRPCTVRCGSEKKDPPLPSARHQKQCVLTLL